jgi:hypothetical protein
MRSCLGVPSVHNGYNSERIIREIPRLSEYSLLYCLDNGRTGEPGDYHIPNASVISQPAGSPVQPIRVRCCQRYTLCPYVLQASA